MPPGINILPATAELHAPFWCPACHRDVAAFGPGGPKARPNAKCPHCGALERHRFLAYILDHHGPVLATSDAVLDIAPQKQIAGLLQRLSGTAYIGTDLFGHLEIDIRTDLTKLPFKGGSIDAIVCYHVLEHIPDDQAAMRELSRILKPGGLLFLQVPWRRRVVTDEDPSAPVEERLRRFGQDDHVRYYGSDFESRLARNGLRPGRIRPSTLLTESQLQRYGIPGKDFMWVCKPMSGQDLDGNPELVKLRKVEDLAAAGGDLDRLEINRLRAQTVQLRRELVVAQGGASRLAVPNKTELTNVARDRARSLYHRLNKVEALAPTVQRAAQIYRRVESSRRRRRQSSSDAANKEGKPSDPAPRVQVVSDATGDPTADRAVISVARVNDDVQAWTANAFLDDFDLVVAEDGDIATELTSTSSQIVIPSRHGDIKDALCAWTDATQFALFIATPDRQQARGWGDTYFARDVQKSLRRLGYPTRVYLRDEFNDPNQIRADVAVHIAGRALPRTRRDAVNVLWIISHPDRVRVDLCNEYDVILVASRAFAEHLQRRVTPPVFPLMQATDPTRFVPDPTGPAHDVLFVGNSRLVTRRRIIDDLTPTDLDLAVYGRDWYPEFIDPRHVRGTFVPNDRLHAYFSSAKIVLNDHWPDMARHGFISNRLYDALASGAFVVSDHVMGLEQEFDDGLVSYTNRDELRRLVTTYLKRDDLRHAIAARGRAAVIDRHTFDHRVQRMLQLIDPMLDTLRPMTDGRNGTGSSTIRGG